MAVTGNLYCPLFHEVQSLNNHGVTTPPIGAVERSQLRDRFITLGYAVRPSLLDGAQLSDLLCVIEKRTIVRNYKQGTRIGL